MPSRIPEPGEILRGKYRVERVLGSGGMGVVVLATHLRMSQAVAIKMLQPDARDREDVVRRFAREARAASRLRGDHAVRIFDVDDREGGDPFLVMEYLEGSDLEDYVRAGGPLPIDDAVAFVMQACAGVAEAHAAGIVHRDLKPANLFLTKRADGTRLVKILDFGISKSVDVESVADFGITKPATAIGSPSYMSPEQLKNAADVDARSDIWSLGVVLYQLLTNALPFEATSTAALAARIAADPPGPLRALRAEVTEELEAVILRCLEKRTSDRFADIAEFARALAPFAADGSSGALRVARVAETRRASEELAKAGGPSSVPPSERSPRPETASLVGLPPNALEKALQTEYGSTLGAAPSSAPARGALRGRIAAVAAVLLLAACGWHFLTRTPTAKPEEIAPAPAAVPSVPVVESPSALPALGATSITTSAPAIVTPIDAGAPPAPIAKPPASRPARKEPAAAPTPTAAPKNNPLEIDFR